MFKICKGRKRNIIMVAFMILGSIFEANAMKFVIDPGHGGKYPGCVYEYGGEEIKEKDLNLKIAKYLKECLSKYKTLKGDDVEIILTREDDVELDEDLSKDLEMRVQKGADEKAEAVISIHNNAHGNKKIQIGGSMVLVTSSKSSALYKIEEDLGKEILKSLQKNIGINPYNDPNNPDELCINDKKISIKEGLLRRESESGNKYDNLGDIEDYYAIVRWGIKKNIPSIIVECAYLSVKEDYEEFLSSDEKLYKISQALAKGIASYYGLEV